MKETIKKFKFRDNGIVLRAPAELEKEFVKLGFRTEFDKKNQSTNTLVFVNNNKEFLNFLNKDLKKVEPDSVLWLAYPKGTSKIKTDINRDSMHTIGLEHGLKTVTAISINNTWTGMRFRPIDQVGK